MTTKSEELIALEDRYGAHNYHPLDVVISKAEGVWVWDVEGNRYLDFLAAYSAVNQGHCHPSIVKALGRSELNGGSDLRAFRNDQLAWFYQDICELSGYERVLPMNTGAEAVETAIKAARKWAYTIKGVANDQAEILVFNENFHGRTTTIVGFSSRGSVSVGLRAVRPRIQATPLRRTRCRRSRGDPEHRRDL